MEVIMLGWQILVVVVCGAAVGPVLGIKCNHEVLSNLNNTMDVKQVFPEEEGSHCFCYAVNVEDVAYMGTFIPVRAKVSSSGMPNVEQGTYTDIDVVFNGSHIDPNCCQFTVNAYVEHACTMDRCNSKCLEGGVPGATMSSSSIMWIVVVLLALVLLLSIAGSVALCCCKPSLIPCL